MATWKSLGGGGAAAPPPPPPAPASYAYDHVSFEVKCLLTTYFFWSFSGVFGQSLEDTIVNESEDSTREIPIVVERCVSYLRATGLHEEGIFR